MHKKEHGRGREENGNDCDCDCDCQPWARAAQTLRRHEANTFGRALSLSLSLSLEETTPEYTASTRKISYIRNL